MNKLPNKHIVADEVQKITGLSKLDSSKMIDAVFEAIKVVVRRDGAVCLQNFGTFKLVTLKARKQRNPQTGEIMDIPSKRKVGFTAAKGLKEYATQGMDSSV